MAPERRLEPLRTLQGRGALTLSSGLRFEIDYRVRIAQHLVDGTPGTHVWTIELTFRGLPEGGFVALLGLFSSDDTALLEVGEDRPPWQVDVLLLEAPPIPWQAPATLRFALVGPPPPHLAAG